LALPGFANCLVKTITRILLSGEDDHSYLGAFYFDVTFDPKSGVTAPNPNPPVRDSDLELFQTFPQIRSISLRRCHNITDAGLAILSQLPDLEELDLSDTDVSAAGLRHLTRMPKLNSLTLSGVKLSDDAVRAINELHLAKLNLSGAEISNTGCELLNCHAFCHLDLSGAKISSVGLHKIKFTSNLQTLDLSSTNLADDAIEALPVDLAVLRLSNTKITDKALKKAHCRNLGVVDLSNTDITDATLALFSRDLVTLDDAIARGDDLSLVPPILGYSISQLSLANTKVTDAGVAHLAEFWSLSDLNLSGTKITDQSVESLKCLPWLNHLNLQQTAVTQQGVKDLQQTLPKCTIEWNGPDSMKQDYD
jgi:Leucine-rich repeat (LRR) protein